MNYSELEGGFLWMRDALQIPSGSRWRWSTENHGHIQSDA